jgi:hypothetical protein
VITMSLRIALACLMMMLTASCVSAFPLTGGNGLFNATVFGTFSDPLTRDDAYVMLYLDVLFPEDYKFRDADIVLVDSDDKFYTMEERETGFVGEFSPRRCFWSLPYPEKAVPKNAELKRVRISPKIGDPFSIEWTGVPEIKGPSMSMKFYGPTNFVDRMNPSTTKSWRFDVKITNTGNQTQSISNDQFEVIDQFGYHYAGDYESSSSVDLMPEESMRFTIGIERVSKLSRPVYLTHAPSNLSMDISAWV